MAQTRLPRHPGHTIGLFIVAGILMIGLIGIPAWRWFFGHGSRGQRGCNIFSGAGIVSRNAAEAVQQRFFC